MENELCNLCGLEKATWGNKVILGTDDRLCFPCFVIWYEEGVTDPAEIKRRRIDRLPRQTAELTTAL